MVVSNYEFQKAIVTVSKAIKHLVYVEYNVYGLQSVFYIVLPIHCATNQSGKH